jgi:hypothetical protein
VAKKFMQHSCNTSITRRDVCGSVLGFWALAANLSRREKEDSYLPLVISFGMKMIDEVGLRPPQGRFAE